MGDQRRGDAAAHLRIIEFPGDSNLTAKKAPKKTGKARPPVYTPDHEEYDRGQMNVPLNTRQIPDLMESFERWLDQFVDKKASPARPPHKTDVVRWLVSEAISEDRMPPWCKRR